MLRAKISVHLHSCVLLFAFKHCISTAEFLGCATEHLSNVQDADLGVPDYENLGISSDIRETIYIP